MILFSAKASAILATELASSKEACVLSINREVSLCKENCVFDSNVYKTTSDSEKKVLEARVNASLKENELVTAQLRDLQENTYNKYLWLGGGIVSGVAFTLLTTWVVKK